LVLHRRVVLLAGSGSSKWHVIGIPDAKGRGPDVDRRSPALEGMTGSNDVVAKLRQIGLGLRLT
jgi:hypothetical protein